MLKELSLDWVSIAAGIVAVLSLIASIFSAIGAARSAKVASSAERRINIEARNSAVRELMRTAANVELEARMVMQALEDASRSAIANAACYSTSDRKMPFLSSNVEFQARITQIRETACHGITAQTAMQESDEWLARRQLDLDATLIELLGEKEWASMRAEQLMYVNRQIAEAVVAEERARGVFVQRDHNGLIV